MSIDVGLSVKKPIKYCDFVGFHARYTDPKTGLRYYNGELHGLVQSLPATLKDEILSVRKANIVLK